MKSVLVHSDMWQIVNGTCVKTEDMTADQKSAWDKKDEKALATILLSVKSCQLNYVKHCKTAAEAWISFKQIHQPSGPARRVSLFKRLVRMQMSEGQTMAQHLNSVTDVTEKLAEIDVTIPDEFLAIIVLSSLPKSYENFVIAMESRDHLPSVQSLKIKLLEEDDRRNENRSEGEEVHQQAFVAKFRSDHKLAQHRYQKINGNPNANRKCFACGRKGHIASQCAKKKANTCKATVSSFSMLAAASPQSLGRNHWCLDSGATAHMCCNREMYTSFNVCEQRIDLAGNKYIKAEGIGEITLKTKYGEIKLLNVLYVPDLEINFLSVSKAAEKNKVTFDTQCAKICDSSGKLLLKAEKRENLYTFENSAETVKLSFSKESCEVYKKWHERYGHINLKDLQLLSEEKLVHGLKIDQFPKDFQCVTCMKSKITVQPFPKCSESRSEKLLELVHTDVCGPMKTKSIGGSQYFLTFIDDKSRKMFVYFIRSKDEVFEVFKNFKVMVERETGEKIKVIRSDNGGEYISNNFLNFLKENGIRRQLTAPYTPQQNGVAERANRTLVEMARCMLVNSNLEEDLWAEAVNTAVYIRNRSPSKILGKTTPYEIWYGKRPTVAHFKMFGSLAIVLDKSKRKSKFHPKGKEHIMVGYSEHSKAYRLLDRETKNVIISRDALFIERFHRTELKPEMNDYVNIDTETCSKEQGKGDVDFLTGDSVSESESEDLLGSNLDKNKQIKIGPGRPKLIRTGKPGRPAKQYNVLNMMSNLKFNLSNPESVSEALSREDAHEWIEAMNLEYSNLIENKTWDLVELPEGNKPIGCKWVFNIKRNKDGTIERYKARVVAKGCSQRFGVNFTETFSPVVRYSTIRLILALAAEFGLVTHQMDISSAYLNGELNDEVYMQQPEGFEDPNHPNYVLKLKKSLYGLKQ